MWNDTECWIFWSNFLAHGMWNAEPYTREEDQIIGGLSFTIYYSNFYCDVTWKKSFFNSCFLSISSKSRWHGLVLIHKAYDANTKQLWCYLGKSVWSRTVFYSIEVLICTFWNILLKPRLNWTSGLKVMSNRGSAYDAGHRKYGGLLKCIQQNHGRNLPLQFVSHE